jgi:hypothetical protein
LFCLGALAERQKNHDWRVPQPCPQNLREVHQRAGDGIGWRTRKSESDQREFCEHRLARPPTDALQQIVKPNCNKIMMEKKKADSKNEMMSVSVTPDNMKILLKFFQMEQMDAMKYDIWYYISVFHSKTTGLIRLFVYVSSWQENSDREERIFSFVENLANANFITIMHEYMEFINHLKLNYKHKKK